MTDILRIVSLKVSTVIGVPDEERSRPQTVVIDVEATLDLRRAGASDDLTHTVDYGALVSQIDELAGTGERRLLEHLAEEVARLVLDHEGVSGVVVEVGKEVVPVPQDVGAVSVRITRN